ncbi:hypothetical protein KKA85_08640 [bacterium]|nr:hypothetical protein [bacterium]
MRLGAGAARARGVLVHLSEGWRPLSSYAAPAIPLLAPRPRGTAWGSIVM